MKKEIITETIHKEIYVAADGKRFERKEDCEEWESQSSLTLFEKVMDLPHVSVDGSDAYLISSPLSAEILIFIPTSMDEIQLINQYLQISDEYNNSDYLNKTDIGKLVAINPSATADFPGIWRLLDYASDILAQYTKFQTDINSLRQNVLRDEQ